MSICFMAAEALARLRELDKEPQPSSAARLIGSPDRKARLKVDDITTKESLFQPREGLNEEHVETLRRIRKDGRELDHVLVIQVGPLTILLDGHHRLEAYHRHPAGDLCIPVEFFAGSLEEALDAAGEANTRARLQMTAEERQNFAWRRTVLGIGSIKQVSRVAGVSERSVTTMRQVRDRIANGGGPTPSMKPGFFGTWREARKAVREDSGEASFDYEEHMEAKARQLAGDLYKRHGTAFTREPAMTARVLEIMFGDRIGEVLKALRDRVECDPEEEDEESEGAPQDVSGMTF